MNFRGGRASASEARIQFRVDDTAQQLDATDGFTMETATGAHLAAPTARMEFDAHSQPRSGHLEGGVTMDSSKNGRTVRGTSPTAELAFTAQGQLQHAHLERGVVFESDETSQEGLEQTSALHVTRTWRSPVADLSFRDTAKSQVEVERIHGTGGVVVTSESRRGGAAEAPSKMAADDVTGTFAPGSVLQALSGMGHAAIEQTSATGKRQTASGDRLVASFAPSAAAQNTEPGAGNGEQDRRKTREQGSAEQGARED